MYLSIKKVAVLNNYMLKLTFENKEVRVFDVKPYLNSGVFKSLKDLDFFKRVKISFDTISWPNGIDLDPEILYSESNPHRENVAKKAPKKTAKKSVKLQTEKPEKPKRLSKLGEWMRDHPNGLGMIVHDMRAVMK